QDRFYGTLKSEVERIWSKGHVIIFDVDVKGGANLKEYFAGKALSVLIVPPSLEELERRLRSRGTDSEEAIRERLAKAGWELDFARGKFDYELVNDNLDKALDEIEKVVSDFLK
ncbi:MAG: guanylate kinase, partial [Bacteroidales bacterium]|nr:guanylate kinase [Bacteroidales bacterium]